MVSSIYVRKYLGPSLLSLSPPTALCPAAASAPAGQRVVGTLGGRDIGLSSDWTGLEWFSTIALYGHIPIQALDFGLIRPRAENNRKDLHNSY